MKLLVIDTCLEACQAAIFDDGKPLAIRTEVMARGHQERLGALVRTVVAKADIAFAALDRIAVTVGPGSFTGLRVGIAFAKGLAMAIDRPIAGVGTLAALACSDPAPGLKTAVIDAGRGGLWLQPFDDATALAAARNQLIVEADLAEGGRLIGPSASRLAAPGQAALDVIAPAPAAIAALAARTETAAPTPLYLRPPDARPKSK